MAISCGVVKRSLLLVVGSAEYVDFGPTIDQQPGHRCMASIAGLVKSGVAFFQSMHLIFFLQIFVSGLQHRKKDSPALSTSSTLIPMPSSFCAIRLLPFIAARCRYVSPLSFFRNSFFRRRSTVVDRGLNPDEGEGDADTDTCEKFRIVGECLTHSIHLLNLIVNLSSRGRSCR